MPDKNYPTATFGAGCFWGPQEEFNALPGVIETTVGYTGGDMDNPSYEDVCSNETGHVEVTRVKFDPAKISYTDLLNKFWEIHDPTQVNRQGPDKGIQYRSVIFYDNDEQKAEAEKSLRELGMAGKYQEPIVTKIEPAAKFWPAEEYHQYYLKKHNNAKIC